ncbi:MAG: hypothetical protein FJY88_08765 [Candidatus Eisenbacteria bacterium]|nr:hypothetical protein [Candidatus Eisenbacteria bacterium]
MAGRRNDEGLRGTGRFQDILVNLDRRIIFLAIAAAVAFPILLPLNLPIQVSNEARAYFEEIERLSSGEVILLSLDYEPDTMAELDPMTLATLRHAFRKDLRVVAMTTYAGGVGIVERILGEASREYGKAYGTDYVFLGYNPDWSATMLRMGESIKRTYPTDHYGRRTDEIPLLSEVDSYEQIALVATIAASALAEYWVIWAGGKYNEKIITGNTAIQAVLIYPYYQTGQLSGFLGGLKGAAEYERLIERDGAGVRGMDAQSMAHLLIVCFIIAGNAGFLIQRRSQRRARVGGGDA